MCMPSTFPDLHTCSNFPVQVCASSQLFQICTHNNGPMQTCACPQLFQICTHTTSIQCKHVHALSFSKSAHVTIFQCKHACILSASPNMYTCSNCCSVQACVRPLSLSRSAHVQQSFSASMCRVGQNRIYTPYMTAYLVISLPKILYVNCIYMVLANPR